MISLKQLTGISLDKSLNSSIESDSQKTKGKVEEGTETTNQSQGSGYLAIFLDHFILNLEFQVEQDLVQEKSVSVPKLRQFKTRYIF